MEIRYPKQAISLTIDNGSVSFYKTNRNLVYVKLYGEKSAYETRFRFINSLENYFHQFGRIVDIYRLKQKYSYFGDYVVKFKKQEDVERYFSKIRNDPPLEVYLGNGIVKTYRMKVW